MSFPHFFAQIKFYLIKKKKEKGIIKASKLVLGTCGHASQVINNSDELIVNWQKCSTYYDFRVKRICQSSLKKEKYIFELRKLP